MNLYESIKTNLKEDERRDKKIKKNENLFNIFNKYFERNAERDSDGTVYGTRVDDFYWNYGPLRIIARAWGANTKIDTLKALPKYNSELEYDIPSEVFEKFPNYETFGIFQKRNGKDFTEDEVIQFKNKCDEFIDAWNKELNSR